MKNNDTRRGTAHIRHDLKPLHVRLITPYNEEFMPEFKNLVYKEHRTWEPDAKLWVVREEYVGELYELLDKYFIETHVNFGEHYYMDLDKDNLVEPYNLLGLLPGTNFYTAKETYTTMMRRQLAKEILDDIDPIILRRTTVSYLLLREAYERGDIE